MVVYLLDFKGDFNRHGHLISSDDTNVLEWAIGGISAIFGSINWYLNMKTNKIQEDLTAHILHTEKTYAEKQTMNDGFAAQTRTTNDGFAAATRATIALSEKVEKTQSAVQEIALVQATQAANIQNMDKNLEAIADTIKKKAT